MPESSAEQAYLFRHAVLRDAAYELQPLSDRATLHALAFDLILIAFGSELQPAGNLSEGDAPSLGIDVIAAELAAHARNAIFGGHDTPEMRKKLETALRRAAEYATRNFRHMEAINFWCELADITPPDVRGWSLARAGRHAYMCGQPERAEALLTEALRLAKEHAVRALEARASSGLGTVLRQTVRGQETGRLYEEALAIERELGNQKQLAGDLGNVGIFFENHGQLERAEACYREALEIAREINDPEQCARALGQLGDLCRDTGRMKESLEFTRQSLEIAIEHGLLSQQALQTERLGVWQAMSGDMDAAGVSFNEAHRMYSETGDMRARGIVLANIGNMHFENGSLDDAERALKEALSIHREVGNISFQSNTLASLGTLNLRRGKPADALACYEEAITLLAYSGSLVTKGAVYCGMGICLIAAGRTEESRKFWREGAQQLEDIGNLPELQRQTEAMHAACAKAGVEPFNEPEQDAEPQSTIS